MFEGLGTISCCYLPTVRLFIVCSCSVYLIAIYLYLNLGQLLGSAHIMILCKVKVISSLSRKYCSCS